jgi:cytochrome c oxidase assembly protein subunit 15
MTPDERWVVCFLPRDARANAGQYNDWPFYNDAWMPDGMLKLKPAWKNFTENTATVQFDHRTLAYTTLGVTTSLAVFSGRQGVPRAAQHGMRALAVAAWSQAALGVVTLLTIVPVWLGAAHQSGAILTWTCALWVQHALKYVRLP